MTALEIVEFVRAQNPYPVDIFIEPTPRQFGEFNQLLRASGISPDAYRGSIGRRTWESCCQKILQELRELEEEATP